MLGCQRLDITRGQDMRAMAGKWEWKEDGEYA